MRRGLRSFLWIAIACVVAGVSTGAQWVNHPMAGAPRTRDGKVNMTGPVPRLNGKPDLSGIWQVQGDPRPPGGLFGIGESLNSRYFRNVLSDFKPEEHTVPRGEAGIANRAVMMLHIPAVQLKNQPALRLEPLILRAAVGTLTTKETLIPTAARLDIANAN